MVTRCVYTSTPQQLMEVSSLTLSIQVYIYIYIYIYVPMYKVQHNMVPSNTAVCMSSRCVVLHDLRPLHQEYGPSFPHFWMAEAILRNGLGTIPTNRAWQGMGMALKSLWRDVLWLIYIYISTFNFTLLCEYESGSWSIDASIKRQLHWKYTCSVGGSSTYACTHS